MTTASRSLATALPMGALHERLALLSYTTTGDTTNSLDNPGGDSLHILFLHALRLS